MTSKNREEFFLADSDTIMLTHTWGTSCNLKCSFCLNEGDFNLNTKKTETFNYEIADIISNLVDSVDKEFLFIEHGGELLYCPYLHELFEYKIKNTKNYRALFFTNGTSFAKYKSFIDKFDEHIEPYLTFHPMFLNEHKGKEFIKCLGYNIKQYGYCNVSFVYYENLEYDDFKRKFDEYLLPYKSSIKIKVFFDKDMMNKEKNTVAVLRTHKFMSYLDEHFQYKNLLIDDYHANFKAKTTFYFKEEQREDVISKYMSAIEIVNESIMYYDILKNEHEFTNTTEFNEYLIDEYQNIQHSDIDTHDINVINGLIEIL